MRPNRATPSTFCGASLPVIELHSDAKKSVSLPSVCRFRARRGSVNRLLKDDTASYYITGCQAASAGQSFTAQRWEKLIFKKQKKNIPPKKTTKQKANIALKKACEGQGAPACAWYGLKHQSGCCCCSSAKSKFCVFLPFSPRLHTRTYAETLFSIHV